MLMKKYLIKFTDYKTNTIKSRIVKESSSERALKYACLFYDILFDFIISVEEIKENNSTK